MTVSISLNNVPSAHLSTTPGLLVSLTICVVQTLNTLRIISIVGNKSLICTSRISFFATVFRHSFGHYHSFGQLALTHADVHHSLSNFAHIFK